MNMPGMQNKMPGMGMMPSQTGTMSHMGPIQTMQNNPMLTQMNQMGQGNISQQMNQMVPGQMGQLSAGQMQQNMQVYIIYHLFILVNLMILFIYKGRFRKNKYFIFIFVIVPNAESITRSNE